MTIEELHQRRILLEARQREMKAENDALCAELHGIDAQCCERLPTDIYKPLQKRRSEIKQQLYQKDGLISLVKKEICEVSERIRQLRLDQLKPKPDETSRSTIISALADLRQSYQDFSADASRVSTMRLMAAEFARKLDKIIKFHTRP